MRQKGVLNLSELGKIFTIVLLQNVCNFKEIVGVSTYRNNGSTYFCPSFGKITLRWHEFHPFTHYNSSSKALEGNLIHYMRKALNIDIYLLSKFGDHSWKSRYQQLLWDGDPDPPYSTRRTKSIFSDFCQPRRWWTVWKKISRTVWFSRPRSFESQPWNCFVVKWNSLLSEGRVDNSSDQFFTRGVGWNDYLVPGMYVKTLL